MAAIYTLDSETITEGLQGCNTCDEALNAARRIAADREEAVILEDDDGLWRVEPSGVCEPAVEPEHVRTLRAEAAAAGDDAQVAVCDRALAGDTDAQAECGRVIRAARAAE